MYILKLFQNCPITTVLLDVLFYYPGPQWSSRASQIIQKNKNKKTKADRQTNIINL